MIVDGVFIDPPDELDGFFDQVCRNPGRAYERLKVCRNPGRAYERLKELVESSPFHEVDE